MRPANVSRRLVKAGDNIGQFTMLDVNTSEITFQWTTTGEVVHRPLRDLADRGQAAAAPAPAAAAPAAPPPPVASAPLGPGELTPQGVKTCQAGDSTPDGTVVGGFRKTTINGPFGKTCLWDPVK